MRKRQSPVCFAVLTSLILTLIMIPGAFPALAAVGDSPTGDKTEEISEYPWNYESPVAVSAREILPEGKAAGDYYAVDDKVASYGCLNVFSVISDFGAFTAYGNDMLDIRIQEIRALEAVRVIKGTAVFAEALRRAERKRFFPLDFLIRRPTETISGAPEGIWKYMYNAAEMVKIKKSGPEYSLPAAMAMIEALKREIAYGLRVDVYSSNPAVQKDLNSLAWTVLFGGVSVNDLLSYAPKELITRTGGARVHDAVDALIREKAPDALREMNKELLDDISGVGRSDIEAFQNHPAYSPRCRSIIIRCVSAMADVKNRDDFVELLRTARSETDAFFFRRTAEMMQRYHEVVQKADEIRIVNNMPACYSDDDRLMVPLFIDRGVWSRAFADFIQALIVSSPGSVRISGIRLYVSGELSPRAEQELKARGITVHEYAFKDNPL